jgi:hypothetical protein
MMDLLPVAAFTFGTAQQAYWRIIHRKLDLEDALCVMNEKQKQPR